MKKEDIKIENLLDIDETIAKSLFKKYVYPFEVLKDISSYIIELGSRLGEKYNTKLRKLGAIVGDFVEVGCGSILNPGTIIGRNTNIYPLSSVRGCIDSDSIYKDKDNIIKKKTH